MGAAKRLPKKTPHSRIGGDVMATGRQIKAARSLLGWSQGELGERAEVSLSAVHRCEAGHDTKVSTLRAMCRAIMLAGIEFLPADITGEGVRIRRPR